ncbi:holdfast anchor protein HfaD [Caulobacter sp. KR2-114]|uniref:holdfast anchor protein HfaD n=1 Tax=Caulobacter sp. KR2-114 TaxID=3400912 RepID=UPI003C077E7B
MPRPVKILRVGTLAAIPMWLLFAGTATSQTAPASSVDNTQVQSGDIFSSGALNVVTASDATSVVTSSGNTLTGSVDNGGNLALHSSQTTNGAGDPNTTPPHPNQVDAVSTMSVAAGASVGGITSTTAATGNSLDSGITQGATLSATVTQAASGAPVHAESNIDGSSDGVATNVSQATQAITNSAGFGATDSTISATVTQTSSATARSDAETDYTYVGNNGDANTSSVAALSSAAVGNNVTSVGVGNSAQTLNVNQSQTDGTVQGTQFAYMGSSQESSVSATATANNFNATNEQGAFNVTTAQTNDAYVHAQSVESSYEFGGASVSAYGVGNSTYAGNSGAGITLDNTQVNGTGGVQSEASFTGVSGYDAAVASTAMGNAATGFSCASCGGGMTIRNSQTNLGDISSTASTTINSDPANGVSGIGRSVSAISTAVGNNATFYVTQPNH